MRHMGEDISYLRVSTGDKQTTDSQVTALARFNPTRSFEDIGVSGSVPVAARRGWCSLREYARSGDRVHVARLDRIARSVRELLDVVDDCAAAGITIHSAAEGFEIDPNNPVSKLLLSLLGSVAEFERSLIQSRVREGIDGARARGVHLGRSPILDEARTRDLALAMLHRGNESAASVAERFGVSRATAYRLLERVEATSDHRGKIEQ